MPVSPMFKILGMFDTHTKSSVNLVVVPLLVQLHQLNLVGRTPLLFQLIVLPNHLLLQLLHHLLPNRSSLA